MTEGKEEIPPHFAGIVRDQLDEIKAIRSLLADVYKDAGDGRTLFRELVQNADDSKARRLTLTVVERGWPDAENRLLHGPALLVANDGPFPGEDRKALHKAIGGSKEGDVDKIGTFGIGLKSVFHICEAFLYIGASGTAQSEWRPGVLNPWCGTGEDRNADPLFPDWDEVSEEDRDRLRVAVKHLLGKTDNGLLLWIPLRRYEHDRGADSGRFWLGDDDYRPSPEELCSWFDCSTPAALLLAQCAHLLAINARRAANPETLGNSVTLMRVARSAETWVGRYSEESSPFLEQPFRGEIESGVSKWSAVGVESLDGERLRDLRSHRDWPSFTDSWKGRYVTKPRKALAHAAVTVLRPVECDANQLGMRLRWAVFLPLDDHPDPSSSPIVESSGPSPAWNIILHGYFWPEQDRRSIPGVTDEEGDLESDGKMRDRWNRRLCEELLLPLLPRALAEAVDGIDEYAASSLLERVVKSGMLENRMPSVTRRNWLLPVLGNNRVHWKAIAGDTRPVLSIRNWSRAPEDVRAHFLASCREAAGDTVFIEETAPRLSGELGDWTVGYLERLLYSIPVGAFASVESLGWIAEVVRHILGLDGSPEDVRVGVFIRWLAQRVSEGALAPRRTLSQEARDQLRKEWRDLCAVIPEGWLVETPARTRQAVVELAQRDGVMGKGLFLLPIPRRRSESRPTLNLDNDRLDQALTALGERLQVGTASERMRDSRLLLAETLLSIHPERQINEGLLRLPILRATRLPEEKNEAWSAADLLGRVQKRRVFGREEGASDPKAAVKDLATALGEPVWLVNRKAVAFAADVPTPEPEALADAVLQTEEFAGPESRSPLLGRLVSHLGESDKVRLSARALLAGRPAGVVGSDTNLFRTGSEHRNALLLLLSLLDRSWCAVDSRLAGALSQNALQALRVLQPDVEALHGLLDECLINPVDWKKLKGRDARRLLEHLHGMERQTQQRWRRMPLHRDIYGVRGAFDDRAVRSNGRTDERDLPSDLLEGIQILDPDPEVSSLYGSVPVLNEDRMLQLMLQNSHPWRYANRIVRHLSSGDGTVVAPGNPDLRQLLKARAWLPGRHGQGLAPEAVLIAPHEVLDAVRDLAKCGAFGDKRIPDAVDPTFWRTARPIVREVLGRMGRARQIGRIVDALVPDRVAKAEDGAWLVLSEPEQVNETLISSALQTTLVGSHPGWKFLHTVRQLLGNGDGQLLVKLARSLCGPVPPERQIEVLTLLADTRPAKDSPGGHTFRRLLGCFTETNHFFEQVLPRLELPTQDGNWHAACEVARTETGVARKHLVVYELRPALRLTDDDRPPQPRPAGELRSESVLDTLKNYFEPWRNRVPHSAVGAFLVLLGPGLRNTISDLTEEWLGQDVSVEGLLDALRVNVQQHERGRGPRLSIEDSSGGPVDQSEDHPSETLSVWISPHVSRGDHVLAANVIGDWVEMEAEPDTDTLFATDPVRYPQSAGALASLGPFWEINLRHVDAQSRTNSELTQLLSGTVERWAIEYLELDRERVRNWWRQWAESSQADLLPVLASIRAHLPLTLRQLNVADIEPLRVALREAERAQRKREQAPSDPTIRRERRSLDHLAKLVESSGHQDSVWERVNQTMRLYGYRPDSVLLELAQNADDALAQAAEIKGGPLTCSSRRFLVKVGEIDDIPTVDVMHWGRTINDTGGTSFPAGQDRQWDQDLYFMMLLNLSSKPGEAPGDSLLSATTGRFGLGFKSVHLVSPFPFVVSGFIAFSIAGGILPVEEAIPEDADSWMTDDRRATLVRMPLRTDRDADKLIGSLFDRFSYARVLLPVFARQIREVVVEGGPYPGARAFDGKQIERVPAWSISAEAEFPNHRGRWRILRFRPSDAARGNAGTSAVAVGIRDGVPTAFEPDMPFIWNVTPTSENWACGYAVNGPFKLDPGRTHVSLDDEITRQAVRDLGNELGQGLVDLHDALMNESAGELLGIPGVDARDFLSALWGVLASGMDNSDELRSLFLRRLHGGGRGLSGWTAARSVVPTDLPAPFPPMLPPMSSGMSWEVASDGLGHPNLCAALAQIEDGDVRSLVRSRHIVSAETDRLLAALLAPAIGGPDDSAAVGPGDLLAELAKKWEYRWTPARLRALRPLTRAAAWESISRNPLVVTWRHKIRARAIDGSYQRLHGLLIGEAPQLPGGSEAGTEEELLLSGFAPKNRVLDPEYIACPEDWELLRWLRLRAGRADDREVATWYRDTDKDLRPAALRYLLYGRLRTPILQNLIPRGSRPPWLDDFDGVRRVLQATSNQPWEAMQLLSALFPNRFRDPESEPAPGAYRRNVADSEAFFDRLSEWWDNTEVRREVIATHESRTWPDWLRRGGDISDQLQAGSENHWLALLVLGAYQQLGRTRDPQHRGFLELVHDRGWWDIFLDPDNPAEWMRMLREWQDDAIEKLTYPQWMSLFPTIYQLSRYREVYVRLLKSAGHREARTYAIRYLLAPRRDLTGAGTQFDAPPAPLNMGLHWVLRELMRLGVIEGEHLYPDCWMPSKRVLALLERVGFIRPDDGTSNPDKARAVFDFMASQLGTPTPNLHLTFDIPLRYVDSNPVLGRQLGLEQ